MLTMTKTILRNLLKKYSTRLYPVEQRILPDGFRGRFKFAIDKCILCRSCVIKCPTKVIRIDPEIGLWEREVMGCLYCGVCADVCPTGCIAMTNVHRPPITEQQFLRFNVKPRPAKKKTDTLPKESEIKAAIEEKMTENAKAGISGKAETLEEDAVMAKPKEAPATAAAPAPQEAAAPAAPQTASAEKTPAAAAPAQNNKKKKK